MTLALFLTAIPTSKFCNQIPNEIKLVTTVLQLYVDNLASPTEYSRHAHKETCKPCG